MSQIGSSEGPKNVNQGYSGAERRDPSRPTGQIEYTGPERRRIAEVSGEDMGPAEKAVQAAEDATPQVADTAIQKGTTALKARKFLQDSLDWLGKNKLGGGGGLVLDLINTDQVNQMMNDPDMITGRKGLKRREIQS